MKKFISIAILALITISLVSAAETAPVEPKVTSASEKRVYDDWTILQIVFFPKAPSASWNSNVYGIKTGWPISCGIGRVFGLEASWLYSGTSIIKGLQACWICCKANALDGIQASLIACINVDGMFNGLQASLYCQTDDLNGAQGGLVSIAGDVNGLQAGLAFCLADEVNGFQASAVSIARGKLNGIQCNLYGQVADSSGIQFGVVNVSGGKGIQFGAINIMKDAWIPVFPILNFAF